MPTLLHYRSWQGSFHGPWWSVWPIARVSLGVLLRRKLVWALYGFGLLFFLMFFFGNFLLAWAQSRVELSGEQLRPMGDPSNMLRGIRRALSVLNGSQETFQFFYSYQGGIVVVTLALVGSLLVGNDFAFKSLGFYLAKPISRWHYVLGKCLAVFLVVMMMTTLPALGLYSQHASDDWDYLWNPDFFIDSDGQGPAGIPLLLAVVAYGTLLSAFLSLLLVATASWMRRTMPLILVWMALFFFLRLLAGLLVDGLKYDVGWRLLDLWNDLTLLGRAFLGFEQQDTQPELWQAALVLSGVCAVCLIYLNHRTRAVEIVR